MGTISSAYSIISGALDADQSALSIVANNVANANTTGYTQEVPNWQENPPITVGSASYGDGVEETGPTSVRDKVLDERLDQQQQLATSSSSRLTALDTLQTLFTPDTGSNSSQAGDIGSDLTSLFNSFSSLEANPTNNAYRQQVLTSGSTLAGDVSNAAASLTSQRTALDQQASGLVTQVNSLTSALAEINQQIQTTSPNSDAGTLEDQRQQDLSQLSQLIGINQITTENNGLAITTTSGQLLVSEGSSYPLTTGITGGVTHFYVGTTDITSQLASGGGQLGGLLTARDQDISSVLSSLDQLAYSVSTQVNTLNNTGSDLGGYTGTATTPLNIFAEPTQVAGSAAAMQVTMTDPNQISAAGLNKGSGDNTNATAMANLASQTIVNGQTPINFYSNLVSTLGATVAAVQTENTAQNASVAQLQSQKNALSSVNLNEQASYMQTFETSYQAASQVFTILNKIITSAINLGESTAVA